MPSPSTLSSLTGTTDASAVEPASHPAAKGGGVGQESKKLRTRCQKRYRGACKEVSVCSLTAHIDRIIQGIKAGKQKTWKLMLVVTLLGDPQEPGGRRERFRVAFPWLCAEAGLCTFPADRGAGNSLESCRDPRQRTTRKKEVQANPGKAGLHSCCFTKIRKFNSCSFQHSWIYSIKDLCLQKLTCCSKFSQACHR